MGRAARTSRRSASESSQFTVTFSAPSFPPSSVASSTQLPSRLSSAALSPSPAGGMAAAPAAAAPPPPPWRALPPSLSSQSLLPCFEIGCPSQASHLYVKLGDSPSGYTATCSRFCTNSQNVTAMPQRTAPSVQCEVHPVNPSLPPPPPPPPSPTPPSPQNARASSRSWRGSARRATEQVSSSRGREGAAEEGGEREREREDGQSREKKEEESCNTAS